jgi:hypothetical protein
MKKEDKKEEEVKEDIIGEDFQKIPVLSPIFKM